MANVNGVVYAERLSTNPPGPANWLSAGYVDGRVKVNIDYYVALGTETTGTVIRMGALLPAGAKVLKIDVSTSISVGSLTMSVGDLDSATRYASAATGPATAGISTFNGIIDSANGPYLVGQNPATPTVTDNDQQIILTTGGATLTVATIIGCVVYYTTD